MAKYVKFIDTWRSELRAATPANLAKPAKAKTTLATLATLAEGDTQTLEEWYVDFSERVAVNMDIYGMSQNEAHKQALVYCLRCAIRATNLGGDITKVES